jgi:hypothetical protein
MAAGAAADRPRANPWEVGFEYSNEMWGFTQFEMICDSAWHSLFSRNMFNSGWAPPVNTATRKLTF